MATKNMSAIATILNPLTPEEEELTTFYNSDSADLVMVHRKTPGNPQELKLENVATTDTGKIKNPSSIALVHYDGSIRVYAIVNSTDTSGATEADPKAVLKQVSPTDELLSPSIIVKGAASLAGIASLNHKNAWLYFLGADESKKTQILEYSLGSHMKPKTFALNTLSNTYLTAVYQTIRDKVKRLVFFQGSSDPGATSTPISCINFGSNSMQTNIFDITTSAKMRSPLAACVAKNAAGTEYVYIYFVDTGNKLNVARIDQEGEGIDSIQIHSAPAVSDWSQLAVTAGATQNFVTYVIKRDGRDVLEIFSHQRQ